MINRPSLNFAQRLGLSIVRITVFGAFILGLGAAVKAEHFAIAGILVIGLYLFLRWWIDANVERNSETPVHGISPDSVETHREVE